ncbi:hypothetical protein J6590_040884 [Homalodisca vitripennis]|nr:hypothetical protein J6590_040884 [Homalodisca vitripennis]
MILTKLRSTRETKGHCDNLTAKNVVSGDSRPNVNGFNFCVVDDNMSWRSHWCRAVAVLATCRDMLSSCSPPDLAVAVQSQLSPGLCLLVTHSASLRKMESKESASFKYDVVYLIELVESHPCLWDKTNKDNKNKIIREKSWKEIFQFLEDGYDELNIEEKNKVGKLV